MRVLAPPPANAIAMPVKDGYQLCARCGQVMTDGETAVVTPRSPFWLIYSHELGQHCPPKATRGWLAAKRANARRNSENKEILRTGEPYSLNGVPKPCVCILDDRHIEAELALVEYQFSDEIPTAHNDLRSLLSNFHSLEIGNGKCVLAQTEPETRVSSGITRHTIFLNFIEEKLVDALDKGCLIENVRAWVEAVWPIRKRTYATFTTAPATNHRLLVGRRRDVPEVRVRERTRTRLPRAPWDILSWDAKGTPSEFALYSKRKLLTLNGRHMPELEARELEGSVTKPRPVDVPFSSTLNPELYTWQSCRGATSGPVDGTNPFGRVARLNPLDMAALNER